MTGSIFFCLSLIHSTNHRVSDSLWIPKVRSSPFPHSIAPYITSVLNIIKWTISVILSFPTRLSSSGHTWLFLIQLWMFVKQSPHKYMLPSTKWAFSLPAVILKSTHFGIFNTNFKNKFRDMLPYQYILHFHWKHFKFSQSLLHHWSSHQWHSQRFLWPRFSCPCVAGISLIPQHQT